MILTADLTPVWPAIWSAVAATFSCAAAIVLMSIHILNRRDSIRPEINLLDWTFALDDVGWGVITIGRIKNEGVGSSLHMRGLLKILGAKPVEKGGAFSGFFGSSVPFLGAKQEQNVDWHCRFQWVPTTKGVEMVALELTIVAADLHGRLYETIYSIVAFKKDKLIVGGMTNLADGLDLSRRHVRITPWWWLKVRGKKNTLVEEMTKLTKIPENVRKYLEKQEWWKKLQKKE